MIAPKLIIGPKCNKLKVYGQNSYNPKLKDWNVICESINMGVEFHINSTFSHYS